MVVEEGDGRDGTAQDASSLEKDQDWVTNLTKWLELAGFT